jgi:hypothetical protein
MSAGHVDTTPHREQHEGETHPNNRHATHGLLKLSGDFCRNREIVARFTDKAPADAACEQASAGVINPDVERYEVIGLRP